MGEGEKGREGGRERDREPEERRGEARKGEEREGEERAGSEQRERDWEGGQWRRERRGMKEERGGEERKEGKREALTAHPTSACLPGLPCQPSRLHTPFVYQLTNCCFPVEAGVDEADAHDDELLDLLAEEAAIEADIEECNTRTGKNKYWINNAVGCSYEVLGSAGLLGTAGKFVALHKG